MKKWAVLVNEFGEVGVDGAILAAQGAVVKEVPGGCLCCVSGLPFQMGLNMLIAREKGARCAVNRTHRPPAIRAISSIPCATNITATFSVLARRCAFSIRAICSIRVTPDNDVYADQIQLADVLVANKTDLCGEAGAGCV